MSISVYIKIDLWSITEYARYAFSFPKVHIPSYRFYDKAPDIVLFQIDFNIASVPGWRLEKRYHSSTS